MATTIQISELRNIIQEPSNAEPYTDEFLSGLIDQYGVDTAAYRVWVAKRNQVAALVDISEGGSSRKMSQVFDQYSKIVAAYEDDGGSGVTSRRAPTTRPITRG